MAWETILNLKNEIKKMSLNLADSDFSEKYIVKNKKFYFRSNNFNVGISFSGNKLEDTELDVNINCQEPLICKISYSQKVSIVNRNLFNVYIPYAVLPFHSEKNKKIYVISHFAQTLDGRIASVSGDSKWIGNQENLVHAHRMRALLEGILVGSKTIESDNPKLSVRHVSGDDPKKIVVGGDKMNIKNYHISEKEFISFSQSINSKGRNFRLNKKNGIYDSRRILETLYDQGLRSVYIEGGSFTTSTFLTQNSIDQVQVHFAPIILGSGVTSFNFKGVQYLKEAVYFKSFRYQPLGNQMMFIGEL